MPAARKTLCERYAPGPKAPLTLDSGRYRAVVKVDELPRPVARDDRVVTHGYAVEVLPGPGKWFFFTAQEPAVAFGISVRMSAECRGVTIVEAAHEMQYCAEHCADEHVLHTGAMVDRGDPDVILPVLRRFLEGVEAPPYSSHWHPPKS